MNGSLEDLVRRRTAWAVLLPAGFLCLVVFGASTIALYRQAMRVVTVVGEAQSDAVEHLLELQRDSWTNQLMGYQHDPDSSWIRDSWVRRSPEFCMVSLFDSTGSLLRSWPRRDIVPPPRLEGLAWTGVESNPRCAGPVLRMVTRLDGGVVGVATLLLDGMAKLIEPYVDEMEGLRVSLVDLHGRPIFIRRASELDLTDPQGWSTGVTGKRRGIYLERSRLIVWSATPVRGTKWLLMARIDAVDIAKQMMPALATLGLFLVGVMSVAGRMARFVVSTFREPVAELVAGVKELEEERWQMQLPTRGLKELEELTNSFARMAQRVAEREKERRSALEERSKQLESALREMESFSYSVSHDLRAPLRAIDGFSQLIQEDATARLLPEEIDALGRIRVATARMSTLIDDLLSLSKASRIPMSLGACDMDSLVREIVSGLGEGDPGRDVQWIIGDLGSAKGDTGLIRQVWINLLSNAFKFTSKKPDARVEVSMIEEGDDKIWTISDNGAGFEYSSERKLFQPFRRFHSDADFPGTGIGLALVRRIVERHGGAVGIESQVGEGTRVWFRLPCNPKGHELGDE